MSLAIFDLDNTLITDDSDYLWGAFLVEKGIVDGDVYRRENDRFYREYKEGTLDIFEFLRFSLKPLSEHPLTDLYRWRDRFMAEKIKPLISEKSRTLLAKHRQQGDILMIITATNRFVTEPIAEELGVEHLLATEPELINDKYSGEVAGTPCFQSGKVERLKRWLNKHGASLDNSHFYSDSHNDLPLLEFVANPIVVDPDSKLREIARQRNWPEISLRA